MKRFLMALMPVVLALPVSAAAPQSAQVFAKLKPAVGAWGQYSYESKKGGTLKSKGTYRFSVVGKEGDAFWLEEKMTPETPAPKHGDGISIMKMLIGGKDGLQKMYVKTGTRVMDMSGMMGASAKKEHAERAKTALKDAGQETVKVAAGSFKATHYSFDNGKSAGDMWVKPGVGPYGLIKQVHTSGESTVAMELLASGDDAKSEVDETTAVPMYGGMPGQGQMPDASGATPGVPPNISDLMNKYKRKSQPSSNQDSQ